MHTTGGALVFPGQGSQEPGMGRELAERETEVMEWWKKAELLSGRPLRAIYWEGGAGEAAQMDDTRNLQPALTVVNLGLWLALSRRFKPSCAAGHSLGEYSALAAARVLSVEAVLELTALRGRLMAEADPAGKGAMAAIVKLDLADAEALVKEVRGIMSEGPDEELRIANYNTPAQFVASGSKAAIASLLEKTRACKGRAIQLAVSGAFHSPYMAEAARELAGVIKKCPLSRARFPVYSNVTGQAASDGEILRESLLQQMTSPVRWIATIRNQFAGGARLFVECGPKNVLGKMVGLILAEVPEAREEGAYRSLTVTRGEEAEAFAG